MTNARTTAAMVLMVGLATGCGSSHTTIDGGDAERTGGSAGSGSTIQQTGGEGGTISVETGGTETGGTMAGGAVTTGGVEATGGNETTGGTGPCIPKTCLTIVVELAGGQTDPVPDACGLVDNGCGNLIDCGGCDENHACGDGTWDQYVTLDDGIPNLCGGGCDVIYAGDWCADPSAANIRCTFSGNVPPTQRLSGGYVSNCTQNASNGFDKWCCSFGQ